MKKYICAALCAAFILTISMTACSVVRNPLLQGEVAVYILSQSESVMQTAQIQPNAKTVAEVFLAKNEYESVQTVFRSESEIKNLCVSVGTLTNADGVVFPADKVAVYREQYITTTKASVPQLPVGAYPDALVPMFDDLNLCDIGANLNQGYYITFYASGVEAGVYEGEISASYDGGVLKIPVSVTVWDFEIPVMPSFQSCFQLWRSDLYDYYYAHGSSLSGMELLDKYYSFTSEFRINAGLLPIEFNSVEEYIQKAAPYFEDEKVAAVDIPYYVSFDENGKIIHDSQNDKLVSLLEEHGWKDKAYYYLGNWIDEPGIKPEQIARVEMFCDDVRSYTDITHIVTAPIRNDLIGVVDGWCPQPDRADEYEIRQRQEAGDEVWWYTSCTPVYPYVNLHTDSPTIAPRIFSWMQRDLGITGSLMWATTIYTKWDGTSSSLRDVWTDTGTNTETVGQVVGDGCLIYPGVEGDGIVNRNIPVATLRLFATRDGAEDYEYLKLLEEKYAKIIEKYNLDISLDDVMDTYYTPLYSACNSYRENPDRLEQVRKIIAAEIMSDDECIVMSGVEQNAEGSSQRFVAVYGAENEKWLYDVLSEKTVEVSVGQNIHSVLLSKITEEEYVELEKKYRRPNEINTTDCDIIISERSGGFEISVYADENTAVSDRGGSYEIAASENGRAKFVKTVEFNGKAATYYIDVTSGENTQRYSYFLVKRASAAVNMFDFSDASVQADLSSVKSNKVGTDSFFVNNLGTAAMELGLGTGKISRFILSDTAATQTFDTADYTHIALTVSNTQSTAQPSLTLRLIAGSANFDIGSTGVIPAKTTVRYVFSIPTESSGSGSLTLVSTASGTVGKYTVQDFTILCLKSS